MTPIRSSCVPDIVMSSCSLVVVVNGCCFVLSSNRSDYGSIAESKWQQQHLFINVFQFIDHRHKLPILSQVEFLRFDPMDLFTQSGQHQRARCHIASTSEPASQNLFPFSIELTSVYSTSSSYAEHCGNSAIYSDKEESYDKPISTLQQHFSPLGLRWKQRVGSLPIEHTKNQLWALIMHSNHSLTTWKVLYHAVSAQEPVILANIDAMVLLKKYGHQRKHYSVGESPLGAADELIKREEDL